MVKKVFCEDGEEFSGVRVFSKTHSFQEIDIFVNGYIGEPHYYTDVFQLLYTLSEHDVVNIHFNSEGGSSETAVQFRFAIQNSEAYVRGIVSGHCMSAASMIFLSCDSFKVADFSIMLCHNYRGSSVHGKGGELFDQISFTREWSENMVREIYEGFLTEEEVVQMMEGKDIWIGHIEARERLEKFQEVRKEKVPTKTHFPRDDG